jgi:hypothetical protein
MNRTVSMHGYCVTRMKKKSHFRSSRQLDVSFVKTVSCSRLGFAIPWEFTVQILEIGVFILESVDLIISA